MKLYQLFNILLILIVVYLLVFNKPEREIVVSETVRVDTVFSYFYETDTVFVDKIKYQDRIKLVKEIDTIYLGDTVYHFQESNYDLKLSASKLNWYDLSIHARDTLTLYKNIQVPVKVKESRFQVGVLAGFGVGLINKQPDIFVGLGVSCRLNK